MADINIETLNFSDSHQIISKKNDLRLSRISVDAVAGWPSAVEQRCSPLYSASLNIQP